MALTNNIYCHEAALRCLPRPTFYTPLTMQILSTTRALLFGSMAVAKSLNSLTDMGSLELARSVPTKDRMVDSIRNQKEYFGNVGKHASVQKRNPQQLSVSENLPEITVTVTSCSKEPIATVTVTTCKTRESPTSPAQANEEVSVPDQANAAANLNMALAVAAIPIIAALF
jgi:hypothetical protein